VNSGASDPTAITLLNSDKQCSYLAVSELPLTDAVTRQLKVDKWKSYPIEQYKGYREPAPVHPAGPGSGFDHGQAIQMDLPGKGAGGINCRGIYANLN